MCTFLGPVPTRPSTLGRLEQRELEEQTFFRKLTLVMTSCFPLRWSEDTASKVRPWLWGTGPAWTAGRRRVRAGGEDRSLSQRPPGHRGAPARAERASPSSLLPFLPPAGFASRRRPREPRPSQAPRPAALQSTKVKSCVFLRFSHSCSRSCLSFATTSPVLRGQGMHEVNIFGKMSKHVTSCLFTDSGSRSIT